MGSLDLALSVSQFLQPPVVVLALVLQVERPAVYLETPTLQEVVSFPSQAMPSVPPNQPPLAVSIHLVSHYTLIQCTCIYHYYL